MKVELLNYTGDALNLLLRTKGTRLAHNSDPATWTEEMRADHLSYMRDTIKSSWEFVDYVFRISGVTRAFTHQLVRTRMGSYAQEAMRVIDARDHEVVRPKSIPPDLSGHVGRMNDLGATWDDAVAEMMHAYEFALEYGVPPQDARGILPTNITTSIIGKFNLRTLSNMAELRLCTRTQGEYQGVFREMKRLVVDVHPWAEDFINVFCVNHAHCAFPRYGEKECPVYVAVIPQWKLDTMRKAIKDIHTITFHESDPRAKEGKAS